jgi:hypothetical protein
MRLFLVKFGSNFIAAMKESRNIEQRGTAAVKRLRITKLRQGRPFMINLKTLPSDQCYLEYPGGKIVLVAYSSKLRDFTPLRELSQDESKKLRSELELELVP